MTQETTTISPQFSRETAKCMGPYKVCADPELYLSAVEYSDLPEMVRLLSRLLYFFPIPVIDPHQSN